MIVRVAEIPDIPRVVDLLKLSLGESLIKKSAVVWNFKHIDNPFGSSHVLVAVENDTFIGVRALMKWNWQLGNDTWIAYRAVDTSTHPDYQGKGIFKKLTLQALDDVQKESEAFVFNTPNDKSRPGYLKMGWVEVSAIPIAIVPTIGYFLQNIFKKNKNTNHQIDIKRLDELCLINNRILSENNVIFTPKSAKYLKWRYEENPMQEYVVLSSNNWYVAIYIKKQKFLKELRVVEAIGNQSVLAEKEIRSAIVKYAIKNNCWIITIANKELFQFKIFGKFGPRLTFKSLTENQDFINKALDIYNWKYSLGDLELF